MRVLITGAAGFLGSHLAEYYLSKGDEVVGIDDFCTSRRVSEHCRRLVRHNNYEHYYTDICNLDSTQDEFFFLTDGKFDIIFNFACPASPPKYQELAIKTINTCTQGLQNILDIAYETDARVVHASTSEVYGDPSEMPQDESYWGNVNPYGPRGCYDNGKRMAETICYEYRKNLGIDIRIVRIFNTYGPHMDVDDGRVITNFIKQALRGEPITIFGDGNQTRSFCYVDDLIDGITRLAALVENDGTPINLGNPYKYTMQQLADKIIERVGRDHGILYLPLPQDDPTQRRPNTAKAYSLLNWNAKTSLDEGLERMIPYMKKVLNK